MKLAIKKVIAREFLILLGTTILFCVLLFIWVKSVKANEKKQVRLENKLEKLIDYQNLPIRVRTYYVINNMIAKNDYDRIKDIERFILKCKDKTKASEVYDYIKKETNFSIEKELFLEKMLKDKESEDYLKSEEYLTQIRPLEKKLEKSKESLFNSRVGDEDIFLLALILFTISYPLRFLIYATIWSLKQLKK